MLQSANPRVWPGASEQVPLVPWVQLLRPRVNPSVVTVGFRYGLNMRQFVSAYWSRLAVQR